MMLLSLLFAASAVSARVMDTLAAIPKDWKHVRPATASEPIALRIALHQQHAEALEQAVIEMSTPGHPNYGMHMSLKELRSYTAPSEKSTTVVTQWLRKYGIEPEVDNDWVSFTTTVGAASDLLGTSFAWYQYAEGGSPKLRTLSYSVPDEVAAQIDLVQPTTRFGQLGAKKSTIFEMHRLEEAEVAVNLAAANAPTKVNLAAAASCSPYVTPACLKSLYSIGYTPSASANNKVAFCSYLEEYARYTDLQSFETKFVSAAKGQNFTVELVNGGLNDQASSDDSGEANLDIQYILGTSHPIPIVEYSTGGRGPLVPTKDQPTPPGSNEPYLEFLTYILAKPDSALPQTISTSYGEEEQSIPQSMRTRSATCSCSSPTFPAGCPYVTSVGATSGSNPEKAVSFSSGGFSIYHARPAYQSTAVATYLKGIGSTYAAYFNASGRAIPDVSAQGVNFQVIDKGYTSLLSGTSASSPVFAGIVALLNAARKSQGNAPLGFLNPWLYNNTAFFTDITTGYGSGCSSNRAFRSGARWNATVGWDPVTGLGTPKFDQLLAAAAPGVTNA
ncbi:tripeptidyl-peptidase [Bombardia bombarda]|uniref:tripeptidyl-peptidase II n=1 Tax=Bombardia bombarda TaxID=252184 RepID=A0AA40CDP9_9PEZI|nr:tripeptidyl-peptidase [Bombardia bombarda]